MEALLRAFSDACIAKFERGDMRWAAEFLEDFDRMTENMDKEVRDKLRRGLFQILK